MIIWLTGLPASGKTTIAEGVCSVLTQRGKSAQLLDGDVIRKQLSPDLGFSKAERDIHIRRIGWLANMLANQGIIAVVAAISPYRAIRDEIRGQTAEFVEVFVDTPLAVCQERDCKGTYQRQGVTGVDDPYEAPLGPEVHVHPDVQTVAECVTEVMACIEIGESIRYSLFIGRWQPFHAGHQALIQSVLDEGKPVCVAIRDTPRDGDNPYTIEQRRQMILKALPGVRVIAIPDISEVCYGRSVGWGIRELRLDANTETISGTAIRKQAGG